MKLPLVGRLPEALARAPHSISTKLLAAFFTLAALLLAVAAVGYVELAEVNERTEDLVKLERKIAVYRQIQHDTTLQLYSVASALLSADERTLDATLRQLAQFGYDLDRLQFVAKDEVETFGRVSREYEAFMGVTTQVVESIRAGRVSEGRELQAARAAPLAERLEWLTNELVNKAEADIVASTDAVRTAYARAQNILVGLAVPSVILAMVLGYAMSYSLISPIRSMDARLAEIAGGDFERRLQVANRDELGTLAANLNRMSVELGRLHAEGQAANRNKSAFLANMSHELRTPLNAIIGFSEVLIARMAGEVNPQQEEFLRDIHSSGKHLLSLVNDLLDLSKIEAGRMELAVAEFDAAAALADALTLVRERAQRQSVALSLATAPEVGVIRADERKFKQVMLNLLSNAVKFTPEGGRVDVRAQMAGGELQVAVSDTGIGIAPEDQAAVFDEFKQVGRQSARHEGTGLGLALARRFVELHGGAIRLESAPGRGSTFTFTLPARA